MLRESKFFTIATAVVVVLVVLGLIVMSSGVLGLIFDAEPETSTTLNSLGHGLRS